jgi:DNA-binding transcriptional LysR family regulator
MDLRQLKYFVAIAEERSFGRAAIRLHLTQPPLTRQMALLEEELGVRLLERTSRGVDLTAAGSVFYKDICNIRSLVEQAAERAVRTSKGLIGTLEVGFFGSGALVILPEILRRFSAAFPDVTVNVLNAPQSAQLQALRQKRLLVAFDRWIPRDPDLTVKTVLDEPVFLAVQESSPWAKQDVVHLEDMRHAPFIVPQGLGHMTWVLGLCSENGFAPKESQRSADMISGLMMVGSGFGCQIVPRSICTITLPRVVYRPLKTRGPASMPLECAYLRGETSPLLPSLLDITRAMHSYACPPHLFPVAA